MTRIISFLKEYLAFIQTENVQALECYGTLDRIQGLMLEAHGLFLPIGCCVEIEGQPSIKAQVMSFSESSTILIPFESTSNLYPSARIRPLYVGLSRPRLTQDKATIKEEKEALPKMHYLGKSFLYSPNLIGRVLNAWGEPIDGQGALNTCQYFSGEKTYINPLEKKKIQDILDVGIRSINGFLTIAQGQRMGIFSFAGVGKSVLIGMMTKNTQADIIIVALIGERGREVKEFIEDILGDLSHQRAIVIASTADESALSRVRAAEYANFLAEMYRKQGYNVLLVMDSLTRYAQAQREIALSIGELPTMGGYPTSTYVSISSLIERAGTGRHNEGSITGFYTILMDSEEDQIADTAKAILDGHIILSQKLANSGHYPAIDISQSISRVLSIVHNKEDIQMIYYLKELWTYYEKCQDMINIGAYSKGSDPHLEQAIKAYPLLCQYLKQDMEESCSYQEAYQRIKSLIQEIQ